MKFKITKGVSCEHFEIYFWENVTIFDMEIFKYCEKKKRKKEIVIVIIIKGGTIASNFPKFFNNAIPPKFFPSTIPFKFFLCKMYRGDQYNTSRRRLSLRSKEKSYL